MVLCIGAKGSGKTVLLKALCDPDNFSLDEFVLPTVGVNFFSLKKPKKERKSSKDAYVDIRELGGELLPVWESYLAKERRLIFVVSSAAVSQVSLVGVKLSEALLALDSQPGPSLCLVWSHLDRDTSSSGIASQRRLLRLSQLTQIGTRVRVTEIEVNVKTGSGLQALKNWIVEDV